MGLDSRIDSDFVIIPPTDARGPLVVEYELWRGRDLDALIGVPKKKDLVKKYASDGKDYKRRE